MIEMLQVLGDRHSKGFYTYLAQSLPEDLIWRALSETKDLALTGQIKKSRGAAFTSTVTRIAQEMGYELDLKQRQRA